MKASPATQYSLSKALEKETRLISLGTTLALSILVGLAAAIFFFYIQAKHQSNLVLTVRDNVTSLVQNSDYPEVERVLSSFRITVPDARIFVIREGEIKVSLPDMTRAGTIFVTPETISVGSIHMGSDNRIWTTLDLTERLSHANYGLIAMSFPVLPILLKALLLFLFSSLILIGAFLAWTRFNRKALNRSLLPVSRLHEDLMLVGTGRQPNARPEDFKISELAEMSSSIQRLHQNVGQLTEEKAKAEGEKRARDSMGSLLHDLANPLQAVTNLLNMFCEHPADDEVRKMLAERWPYLNVDIQKLMSLSRHLEIEAPRMTPSDIAKTMEAGAMAGAVAKPNALKFTQPSGANSNVIVRHDPNLLSRAIANLVRNSVEEGASAVEVWLDAGELSIHIRDDGPGIPKDKVTLMFEGRLKSSKPNGSGVGFPTALRLVKAHRGKIMFNDQYKNGAHMIIDLKEMQREML